MFDPAPSTRRHPSASMTSSGADVAAIRVDDAPVAPVDLRGLERERPLVGERPHKVR